MATVTVKDVQGFMDALTKAASGDIILLEPGVYSDILINNVVIDGRVHVASKDPANPAVIDGLVMKKSNGIHFSDLEFLVNEPNVGTASVQVLGSSDVYFSKSYFHGSLNGNTNDDATGIMFRGSKNVGVSESEFEQLFAGVAHLDSDDLTVAHNYFHDIRVDGVRGGGSQGVLISGNYFTNFYSSTGDHADAIQFWSRNVTRGQKDIVIENNVVVRGAGVPIQGIFISSTTDLKFQNLEIRDNLVVGSLYHGIAVGGVVNLQVTGNEVVSLSDQKAWIRIGATTGAVVTDNKAELFTFLDDITGLEKSGNQEIGRVSDGGQAALSRWMAEHGVELKSNPAFAQLPAAGGVSGGGSTPVAKSPAPAPVPAPPAAGEVRVGTAARDEMNGGAGDDRFDGGAGDDRLVGGDGGDTLKGGDGADVLNGGDGDDDLQGGAGADRLTGGIGRDRLEGGAGNDSYVVDDGQAVIVEAADGGADLVVASIDYALSAYVETLRMIGAAVAGTGNEQANLVEGNAAANRISGLGGDDDLRGADGDDHLDGGAGNDRVSGGEGRDVLLGGVGKDSLNGGADDDRLDGGDDADVLEGGLGQDVLVGGAGADSYVFRSAAESTLGAMDRIEGFSSAEGDRILLSSMDARSGTLANDAFQFLGTAAFTQAAGQLRYEVEGGDAYVYGDVDGDGAADFGFVLVGVSSLTGGNFSL